MNFSPEKLIFTRPLKIGGVIGDILNRFTLRINIIVVYKSKMQVNKALEFTPSEITAPPSVDMDTFFIL